MRRTTRPPAGRGCWSTANRSRRLAVLGRGDFVTLAADKAHRLRFVNIGPAAAHTIRLRRDTTEVEWRRVAVDGADLAPSQATRVPARHRIAVGQTADFEVRLAPVSP